MCTQSGSSPLYYASQEGHDRIVEKLLQAGATVDLQDEVENKLLLFVHLSLVVCHGQYSLYTKYHTTFRGNMKVRKHVQHIATSYVHGRTKAFVHLKYVHV